MVEELKASAQVGAAPRNGRYDLEGHDARSSAMRRHIVNAIVAIIIAALAVFAAFQIYEFVRPPEIGEYADQPVELVGLGEGSVFLTAADLAEMDCQTVSATGTSDKVGQGTVVEKTAVGYGPLLSEVLAQYGYELDDFRRIVFQCRDGYETAILPATALDGPVYLSIARGKDALPEPMQPMRLLMPDMPPGQWVYGIDTITFEKIQ